MSILAVTLPCAGTVPMELPPLNLTPGVADPLPSTPGVNPQPIGAQFYTDRAGVPLNTLVQQVDGVLPVASADGTPFGPPVPNPNDPGVAPGSTLPTAPPNTTTWLYNLQEQTVIAEPFAP